MTRIRYMMSARSQGKLYTQLQQARLVEKDIHRWVFAHDMDPETESLVRKWLTTRLDGFYCDLQAMYMPHIVLNNTPPLHAMARADEARGLTPRDAVVEATGLNPHTNMCGWPFCLDGVDDVEGGAV